jgi:tetratricopeptide (TPR) repeat protein
MDQDKPNSTNQSIDLLLLKKEVDSLQIAILKQQSPPWYKNVPTILSVVALLFSFGTTFVSYKRTQSQDIQNERVELRSLLQKLSSLPRESIEISKRYEKSDPNTLSQINSYFSQENDLLARQAAEIAKKLPPELITSTEYFVISLALDKGYNIDSAKELMTKAIDVSTDLNDRLGALRKRAEMLFKTGQPEAGRVDFQRALNVFSDFNKPSFSDYTKKIQHVVTELNWAYSEATYGVRDTALQRLSNAENHLSGLTNNYEVNQLRNRVLKAKASYAAAAISATRPNASPVGKTSPITPGQ